MNTIVSLLTAGSVFMHAVLGCCIHHAHGTSGDRLCGHAAAAEHEPLCQHQQLHEFGHEHQDQPAAETTNPVEMPDETCDGSRCAAIVRAKTSAVASAAVNALNSQSLVLDDRAAADASVRRALHAAVAHHLGPRLRPHLCKRVLLV